MKDFLDRIKDLPPKKLALLAAQLQERLEQAEAGAPPRRPDRRRRRRLPVPGRRRRPGVVLAAACSTGRDAISEVPADRWDADALLRPRLAGRRQDGHAGGAASSTGSTASTPGSSASPAARRSSMDPQQRLLLEVVVAGARARRHRAGLARRHPHRRVRRPLVHRLPAAADAPRRWTPSTATSPPAPRPAWPPAAIAYVLGLQGPADLGRHRLLVVARGRPPRRAGVAQPASATPPSRRAST